MAHTEELVLSKMKEEDFRASLINEVKSILRLKIDDCSINYYFMLEDFAFDLAFFIDHGNNKYSLKFLELKVWVGHRSGVGFGGGEGTGLQVKILDQDDNALNLASHFIRWILLNNKISPGNKRFVIFNNSEGKSAVMSEVKKGKQNNFRLEPLMKKAIDWDKLSEELENFLLS